VQANNGLGENSKPAVPIARVLIIFLLDVAFIVMVFIAFKLHNATGKDKPIME
jgi:hypothetical protein